jgi:hypothetical protein
MSDSKKKIILTETPESEKTSGYKNGLPVLSVVEEETNKTIGYLTPFRGYRFQISETIKGEGDMASSEVIGFGNIVTVCKNPIKRTSLYNSIYASNSESLTEGILHAFLMECFYRFSANRYGMDSYIELDYKTQELIHKFLKDTIAYIDKLL